MCQGRGNGGAMQQPGFGNSPSGFGSQYGGGRTPPIYAGGGMQTLDSGGGYNQNSQGTFSADPPPMGRPSLDNPDPSLGSGWVPADPGTNLGQSGWTPGSTGNSAWEQASTANLHVPLYSPGNAGRGYMMNPATGRMDPRSMVLGQGGLADRMAASQAARQAGQAPWQMNNGMQDQALPYGGQYAPTGRKPNGYLGMNPTAPQNPWVADPTRKFNP